jgi:hypothetical protein
MRLCVLRLRTGFQKSLFVDDGEGVDEYQARFQQSPQAHTEIP